MNDIEPDDLAPELDPAADKVVYTSPDPVPAPKFIGSLLQGTVSIAALKFEARRGVPALFQRGYSG